MLPGLTDVTALSVYAGGPGKAVLRADGTVCSITLFSRNDYSCERPAGPPVVQIVAWDIARLADDTLRNILRDPNVDPVWLPAEPVTELVDGALPCARFAANGRYGCWWYGAAGLLGDPRGQHDAVSWVPGADDARALAVGRGFYCVLRPDATVACAGDSNDAGQLGDGTAAPRAALGAVPGLRDVVQLVSDSVSTCARRADGTVWCWGRSMDGRFEVWSTPHQIPLPR